MVRVFMIAVMIKGKFEESALCRLSCTFRMTVHQRLAAHACWHSTLASETYQTYWSSFSPTMLSESCIVQCLSHSVNKEPVILKAVLPPHCVWWFADMSPVWMLTDVYYCWRYWHVTEVFSLLFRFEFRLQFQKFLNPHFSYLRHVLWYREQRRLC